jgi:hypothetical protein
MRRVTTTLIATLALLGLMAAGVATAGCGSSQNSGSVPGDAVATVGGTSLPKAQFQELMAQAQTQMKAAGVAVPAAGTPAYGHYAAAIVNYMVQEQVVAQSAAQLGVAVTDKEVVDQVAQLEQAYGGEQKVLSLLKQQGMSMDLLKRSIKSRTLAQRAAAVVTKSAAVADTEIKAYWSAHKGEYQKQKKTATFAKAKGTIKQTLLTAKQQALWDQWISKREKELGVSYAVGYDPAQLTASASPSASGSATP